MLPCWKNLSTCITCASSMSCQSCQLCGVHAAIQFISITSTEETADLALACWKQKLLCLFNVLPALPIDVTFMQGVSSHHLPARKREHTHTCRCQAVTPAREQFSPQFPCSQRVRMMKRVSFVTWRAEKAVVFQAPQPLCEEDFLIADAVV